MRGRSEGKTGKEKKNSTWVSGSRILQYWSSLDSEKARSMGEAPLGEKYFRRELYGKLLDAIGLSFV